MQIILTYDDPFFKLYWIKIYEHFLCTFKNTIFLVRVNLSSKRKIAWRHDVAPERALYRTFRMKLKSNLTVFLAVYAKY